MRILVVSAVVALSGCVWRQPIMLAASSEPIQATAKYTVLGPAVGDACSDLWLWWALGPLCATGYDESVRFALDNAKKSAGADALIEVAVDKSVSYGLISASFCTRVSGKGIRMSYARE